MTYVRPALFSLILGGCAHASEGPRATEVTTAPATESQPAAEPAATTEEPTMSTDNTFENPNVAPSDVAAVPASATATSSGLASRVVRAGSGTQHPTATSHVEVHYSGWTTDGRLFDSSVTRGQTATFPLNVVIAGWTEGVQLMVEGERRRFWIPGNLAYGDTPNAGRPYGMLVFDVELVRIVH